MSEYVKERILALRRTKDQYHNCACLRANAMKHIPNYFAKGQVRTAPRTPAHPPTASSEMTEVSWGN